jgi:hypothetical protein
MLRDRLKGDSPITWSCRLRRLIVQKQGWDLDPSSKLANCWVSSATCGAEQT